MRKFTSNCQFKHALIASTFLVAVPEIAAAQSGYLDEIIVTSTKREQSIQKVGLSVTAITGEDLQLRGVADFEDFAISIPNLSFGATDDGVLANRTITIRGIEGLNTTGFYIDDVPIDESIDPLVLDVERVEVLRGPQGTLYGARGLGGTVRVITKKPSFEDYEVRGHSSFSGTRNGGFNYTLDGSVNIPVSDGFAVRATAYVQEESGIFDRVVAPLTSAGISGVGGLVGNAPSVTENVDDKLIFGGQLALRWQPTNNLELNAKVLAQKTELNGFPLSDFAFDPASPPSQIVLAANDFTQERLFNIPEFADDQWLQASFTASYETEFGTFSTSTGYLERNTLEGEDSSAFITFAVTGGATAVSSPIFQELDFRTIVEEARFVSDFDGPFQMTTGVFYQRTDDDEAFQPPNVAPGINAALGGGLPTGDEIFQSFTNFDVKELGIYGEFALTVFERLTATFGVRYFDTETTFRDQQGGLAVGAPLGSPGAVDIGPINQSEDGFNLKGLLEYDVSENVYLYASAAEGFRIGGANGDLPAGFGCPADAAALGISVADARTFDSDSLWSYEGGAKTTWAGGRLVVNASGFYIDLEDIQQRILLACGFDFVANIGAARSLGFELEAAAQPVDGLSVGLGVGYTDAEFTESVPGLVADGDRLQQVPEWTLSTNVDYEFPVINSDYMYFIRGDFAHVGQSISRVVDSGNPRIRPSYQILNMRIGLRGEQFEIAGFIDNLLNQDAVFADNRTLAAEAPGRPRVVRNRPRTMGVSLRANF